MLGRGNPRRFSPSRFSPSLGGGALPLPLQAEENTKKSLLPADFLSFGPESSQLCLGLRPPHSRKRPRIPSKINVSMFFALCEVVFMCFTSSPLFYPPEKDSPLLDPKICRAWKDPERQPIWHSFQLPPARLCLLNPSNVREIPTVVACQIGPAFPSQARCSWNSDVLAMCHPAGASALPRSVSFWSHN